MRFDKGEEIFRLQWKHRNISNWGWGGGCIVILVYLKSWRLASYWPQSCRAQVPKYGSCAGSSPQSPTIQSPVLPLGLIRPRRHSTWPWLKTDSQAEWERWTPFTYSSPAYLIQRLLLWPDCTVAPTPATPGYTSHTAQVPNQPEWLPDQV